MRAWGIIYRRPSNCGTIRLYGDDRYDDAMAQIVRAKVVGWNWWTPTLFRDFA